MKIVRNKSWISFAGGFACVLLGALFWHLPPPAQKFSRSPASVKRLDERGFPETQEQTLMLWVRMDYRRVKEQREFHVDSHVVVSPALKLPRNGAQAITTGRFTSVPIYDENGKLVENIEFENPNLPPEPFLLNKGQSATDVRFEDGNRHSYFLRLPIADNLPLFRRVLQLGAETSARSEALLDADIRKLESIYILPAIKAVLATESKTEASSKEAKTVRVNVMNALAAHFESPATLARLQSEANKANARIAAGKNSASNSSTGLQGNRAVAAAADTPQATVRTLSIADENGNPVTTRKTNRIKLVFLGDGFQASEMEKFFQAAQDKLDYLMKASAPGRVNPFFPYKAMFNAVAVFVPSNESGACHPENNTPCPDTIFKTSFNTFGIVRLLAMSGTGSTAYGAVMRAFAPDYDLSVIISNDSTYGGGGGIPAYVSLDQDASDVIAHEMFGHSFAHLGDEYAAPYPGYPDAEEPNTTTNGDPTTVKWAQWEQIDTQALNGNSSLVVHAPVEGAHYHATGWYRPATNCKMAAYGAPFCPVCSETIIRAIYSKAKPIDAVTPAAGDVDTSGGNWSLNVLTAPVDSELQVQWSINGQALDLNGASTFTPDSLNAALSQYPDIATKGAPYRIDVQVVDNTAFVSAKGRQDKLLQDSVSWNLK
jgi:hypothetical protein